MLGLELRTHVRLTFQESYDMPASFTRMPLIVADAAIIWRVHRQAMQMGAYCNRTFIWERWTWLPPEIAILECCNKGIGQIEIIQLRTPIDKTLRLNSVRHDLILIW
jgi:hypothetical protein